MKLKYLLAIGLGLTLLTVIVLAQTNPPRRARVPQSRMISVEVTNSLGAITNGPVVVETFRITQSWSNPAAANNPFLATNPAYLRMIQAKYIWTNTTFEAFRPNSLSQLIWTNFLAHTNGRTVRIWSERTRPPGWPAKPPVVTWNTNSVIWGLRGITALSPCWQDEGNPGQLPLTALSRRHAYTRGHQMGSEGFNDRHAGAKVWFLTLANKLVEVRIKSSVTRTSKAANGANRDYTLFLFDRDLPDSIQPLRVIGSAELQTKYPAPRQGVVPHPIFGTEQGGSVSTGVAPLVVNTWKGGDSGSPNLLPLPGELVFFSGRSTTGPSPEMQADMDELCRKANLDPTKYQLHWVDLSAYPSY